MNINKLFNNIVDTVWDIEKNLKSTNNTGIFFAPELYTAFYIGINILKDKNKIFGNLKVEWQRETSLGNGSISDIIFKSDESYTIIELKIRDNIHSYKTDIAKLQSLGKKGRKFFCVIVDSFSSTNDNRLIELEKDTETIFRVGRFAFPTWNNRYKQKVFCILNLYSIK